MGGEFVKQSASALKTVLRAMIVVALFVFLFGHSGMAFECGPGAVPGAMPIPGDPVEKGKLLVSVSDDQGNMIQEWCVQGRKGIHGTDFGIRYVSADEKTQVWVGGCFFPAGINRLNADFKDTNPANGKPDKYLEVTWFNAQPAPGGMKDWHFSYDISSRKLTVTKTKGKWSIPFEVEMPDEEFFAQTYITTAVVGPANVYEAPTNFTGLTYGGKFIEGQDPPPIIAPQVAVQAFGASAKRIGEINDVSLRVIPFGGTGTETDPFLGLETQLFSGDLLTIAGVGIASPTVTGLAALPAYGGWTVSSYSSSYVTFRDTADVTLEPGTFFDGFDFSSSVTAIGQLWTLVSADEASTSAGNVVPEPSAILLTSVGILMLGAVRNRRAWGLEYGRGRAERTLWDRPAEIESDVRYAAPGIGEQKRVHESRLRCDLRQLKEAIS
jgi:hypothetical protein